MLLEYLELGKIVSTHGVKGELRVQPWCDSSDFFKSFKTVYTARSGKSSEKTKYKVISARPHGNIMLLTLDGIADLDKANSMRNNIVYVKREDAPIEKGSYFVAELIGCTVVDADDETRVYGKITDVMNTGASDIWNIKADDGKEYLLPSVPGVIDSVNVKECITKIRPIKGIFDEGEEIRED